MNRIVVWVSLIGLMCFVAPLKRPHDSEAIAYAASRGAFWTVQASAQAKTVAPDLPAPQHTAPTILIGHDALTIDDFRLACYRAQGAIAPLPKAP